MAPDLPGLCSPFLSFNADFRVAIYERRPDTRRVRVAGRSINLAISVRGIHALREAGLWESMRNIIIPMKGRMMHSLSGELTFQPYGKDETEVINSISRADLNVALMNEAENRGVKIHFNERCIGFDLQTDPRVFVTRKAEVKPTSLGLSSLRTVVFRNPSCYGQARTGSMSQSNILDHGYKELTITAGPHAKHVFERNALHIWPRGSHMLIALPNIDGTFACILFLPVEGKLSFANLDSESKFAGILRG